jgi:hypothetical protein
MKYQKYIGLICILGFIACSSESTIDADPVSTLNAAFAEFDTDNTDIYIDGSNVVIETNGLPNHTSPYWGSGNKLYVAPQSGFSATPSLIPNFDGSATLTVSANPQKASKSTSTSLGSIGIAISGAAIFNDQEGNGALSGAAVSLDYTGAHIGPGVYHYHTEPEAWSKNDNKLIGIMADGFFIYGRKCNSTGTNPTDLDASNGHTSVNQYSTTPVYHYHIDNDLYINKYYIIFPGNYQGTPSSIR